LSRGGSLGRGIVTRGRWANEDEAQGLPSQRKHRLSVPLDFPSWALNKLTVTAFNEIYFSKHGKARRQGVVHPEPFFYPLDRVEQWNRVYGSRGFIQYQCVVPREDAEDVGTALLSLLQGSGQGSFLSVVKDCGNEGKGSLSFPMPGVSLAFDLPMCGESTRALVENLNRHVLEAGGRIYLAKDALTSKETYRAMDPRVDQWNAVRRKWDPNGKFRSALSERVFGDWALVQQTGVGGLAVKVVFLGATRGMGRALAQAMAMRGDSLCLLGRDLETLQECATDLELRGATGSVSTIACDLLQSEKFTEVLGKADESLNGFDCAVVTAGAFAVQETLEEDEAACASLLDTNFTRTLLFCEAARKSLLARGGGKLCVFSSVAGDRARKPVILYGASKAGLSYYLEGLDHKFRDQGLEVITVKPGFVRTGMTVGLPAPPFAGEPEQVAVRVLKALDRGTPVVYAPGIWCWVMTIIRLLPRAVMRKVGF
jgi:decaprenylphospho-beta-D-erythro-pentofuranosid-2-ulose 2-reductase